MTETDLITAGGSGENVELPQHRELRHLISQATPPQTRPTARPPRKPRRTADVASGDRPASLSTMVLPELRALAKQIGVEGASGMRKSELIAAIRERRGESNGRSAGRSRQRRDTDTAQRLQPTPRPSAGTTEQRRRGSRAPAAP